MAVRQTAAALAGTGQPGPQWGPPTAYPDAIRRALQRMARALRNLIGR